MKTKICIDCQSDLPLSHFGANGTTKTGKPKLKPRCGDCLTVYEKTVFWNKIYEVIGGEDKLFCQRCQYDTCRAALVFHHVDPSKKDRQISFMRNYSAKQIAKEIAKCIILCSNCHAEVHAEQRLLT